MGESYATGKMSFFILQCEGNKAVITEPIHGADPEENSQRLPLNGTSITVYWAVNLFLIKTQG